MKLIKIYFYLIFLFISTTVISQVNNCIVPGYPGCSREDFDRALMEQRQLQIQQRQINMQQQQLQLQQQQLYEAQRNNQILEQQNNFVNPVQPYNSWQQRCLSMPLGTRGC